MQCWAEKFEKLSDSLLPGQDDAILHNHMLDERSRGKGEIQVYQMVFACTFWISLFLNMSSQRTSVGGTDT